MIMSSTEILTFISNSIFTKFSEMIDNDTSTAIGFADKIYKTRVDDIWKYAERQGFIFSHLDFEINDMEFVERIWANKMVECVEHYYKNVDYKMFLSE